MICFWSDSNYRYLSNFYPHPIEVDGVTYLTTEHYYQSQKTLIPGERESIRQCLTPGRAKRMGKKITIDPNWSHRKFSVMIKCLLVKFSDPELREKLLATGESVLVEDSPKDLIWGSGVLHGLGEGSNLLGKSLMFVRSLLQKNISFPLQKYSFSIPEESHPGAFAAIRKFDIHTGVDLYSSIDSPILAMTDGMIEKIIPFTGPSAKSPWWAETQAIIVRHNFGFVLYGELKVAEGIKDGCPVTRGQTLGLVQRVLKTDKGKPMDMLHLELYSSKVEDGVIWNLDSPIPPMLLDPTVILKTIKDIL